MRIKDRPEYNTKIKPKTFLKTDTVRAAITVMSENNFGSVVIVDKNNHVQGIVTERDLMIKVLHKKKDPSKTKLSSIMTKDVRVAREDDKVLDWLRTMSNDRFRHLPIVDADGKLINLMSQGDFVSYTWPELITRMTAKTKETLGAGYQVALIVTALLAYALLVNVLS